MSVWPERLNVLRERHGIRAAVTTSWSIEERRRPHSRKNGMSRHQCPMLFRAAQPHKDKGKEKQGEEMYPWMRESTRSPSDIDSDAFSMSFSCFKAFLGPSMSRTRDGFVFR